MSEFTRSVFNRRFVFLVLFCTTFLLIFGLLGVGGWRTYINWDKAEDIIEEKRFDAEGIEFKNMNGNFFRLMEEGSETFKLILPVLLVFPYMHTYIEEKTNRYRYWVLTRKKYKHYLRDKILSIIFSSILAILLGQLIAYVVFFCVSAHVHNPYTLSMIVREKPLEEFFFQSPYLFWAINLCCQVIYMVCFQVFAIGIASFLKRNVYIYVLPFVFYMILSAILPEGYRLENVYNITQLGFRFDKFLITMCMLVISGFLMLIYNENRYRERG